LRRSWRPAAESLEGRALLSTIQNFDGNGTAFALGRYDASPGPLLLSDTEGIEDRSLRLASALGETSNAIGFARTDAGRFRRVDLAFDMRVTQESGRGEGLGVALLNTSVYGNEGTVSAPGGLQEEPNFTGSFGLGFDLNRGESDASDNSISVHYNGRVVQDLPIPRGFVDFADGRVVRVQVALNLSVSGSSMSLTLTPQGGSTLTVVEGLPIPGLEPYASRVQFAGRSGEQAHIDIDNIQVDYAGAIPNAPFRLDATSYTVRENAGYVDVRVMRQGAELGTETVQLVTVNGTAAAGRDYTAFAGTVAFASGETTKVVRIPIRDNLTANPDRQFTVVLSSGLSGPLQQRATVTILDDETALIPPTVSRTATVLHRGVGRNQAAFVLTFSKPMSATVTETSRYQVLLVRPRGPARPLTITGAVYDATKGTVTLSVAERNLPVRRLRVVARGTGPLALTDLYGNALDGDRDGRPGGDAVLPVQ
jgi:hypothetical protein